MKWSLELPIDIGDNVYIVENDRNWAKIDEIIINDENRNGHKNVTFYWYQMDESPDGDELWDEGWFDLEDIGTKVLIEGIHDDLIKENMQKKENYYFECMHRLVKENCGEYILHGKRACAGCKLSRANYESENCVKVDDDEEISICNYYRQQDGRCRATRDCEWEGCNGDRSKCPHNKIKVL